MPRYLPETLLNSSAALRLQEQTQPLLDALGQKIDDGLSQAKQMLAPDPLPTTTEDTPIQPFKLPSFDEIVAPFRAAAQPQAPDVASMGQQPKSSTDPTPFSLPSFDQITSSLGLRSSEPTAQPPQAASGTPQAMPTGGPAPTGGAIDNSSREAFVRTAYPYALQAANGDTTLANQLVATAISENGKVGTGRDLGEMGFNVGGIQGVKGTAGSFTALDAGRPREFAAYNNLAEGFRAVRDLVSSGRYADAAAAYRQHGDIDRYWGDVNRAGYSETPTWQDGIASIRRNQVEPLTAGLSATAPPAGQPSASRASATPSATGVAAPQPPQGGGFDVQGTAQRYAGGTYTFGGGRDQNGLGIPGDPNTDCSGFVSAVMREQGVALPAHTDAAYTALRNVGAKQIDPSQAQPGDIVFYMGAGYGGTIAYHMGLYAGPGQILDASRWQGDTGVKLRPITHAGGPDDIVILRDPRVNGQPPRQASAPPPPITPSGVAETPVGDQIAAQNAAAPPSAPAAATPPAAGASWSPDEPAAASPGAFSAPAGRAGGGGVQSVLSPRPRFPDDDPNDNGEYDPRDAEQGPHEWRPEYGTPGLGESEQYPSRPPWRVQFPVDDPQPGERPYDVTDAEGMDASSTPLLTGGEASVPPLAPPLRPGQSNPYGIGDSPADSEITDLQHIYRQPLGTMYRQPQPGTSEPIANPDGSVTTERSITVTEPGLNGGRATNIPTVWNGQIVSDDEAVQNAIDSGVVFPSFGSVDEAVRAAEQRSRDLGAGQATSVGGAAVPPEVQNALPYRNRAVRGGPVDEGGLQYRQPLSATGGPDTTPDAAPMSSYNDPTANGTQDQPLPQPVTPSYNDPTDAGTQLQPLPSQAEQPFSPYDNGPPDATHRIDPGAAPESYTPAPRPESDQPGFLQRVGDALSAATAPAREVYGRATDEVNQQEDAVQRRNEEVITSDLGRVITAPVETIRRGVRLATAIVQATPEATTAEVDAALSSLGYGKDTYGVDLPVVGRVGIADAVVSLAPNRYVQAAMQGGMPIAHGRAGGTDILERGAQAVVGAGREALGAVGSRVRGALSEDAARVAAPGEMQLGSGFVPSAGDIGAPIPRGGRGGNLPSELLPEASPGGGAAWTPAPEIPPEEVTAFRRAAALSAKGRPIPPEIPVVTREVPGRGRGAAPARLQFFQTSTGHEVVLPPSERGGAGQGVNAAYKDAISAAGGYRGRPSGRWQDRSGAYHQYDSPQELLFMNDFDLQKANGQIDNWWRGGQSPYPEIESLPYIKTTMKPGESAGPAGFEGDFVIRHPDGRVELVEAKDVPVLPMQEEWFQRPGQRPQLAWNVVKKAAGAIPALADRDVGFRLITSLQSAPMVPKPGPSPLTGRGSPTKSFAGVFGVDWRDIPELDRSFPSAGPPESAGNRIAAVVNATAEAALVRARQLRAQGVPADERRAILTRLVRDRLLRTADIAGRETGETRMVRAGVIAPAPSWQGAAGRATQAQIEQEWPAAAEAIRSAEQNGARVRSTTVDMVQGSNDVVPSPRMFIDAEGDPAAIQRLAAQLGAAHEGGAEATSWHYDTFGPTSIRPLSFEGADAAIQHNFTQVQAAFNAAGEGIPQLVPQYTHDGGLATVHVIGRDSAGAMIPDEDVLVHSNRVRDVLRAFGIQADIGPPARAVVSDFAAEGGYASAIERREQQLGLRALPSPPRGAQAADNGAGAAGRATPARGRSAPPEAPATNGSADLNRPAGDASPAVGDIAAGGSGFTPRMGGGLRSTAYNAAQGALVGDVGASEQERETGQPYDLGRHLTYGAGGAALAAAAGNRTVRRAVGELGSGFVPGGGNRAEQLRNLIATSKQRMADAEQAYQRALAAKDPEALAGARDAYRSAQADADTASASLRSALDPREAAKDRAQGVEQAIRSDYGPRYEQAPNDYYRNGVDTRYQGINDRPVRGEADIPRTVDDAPRTISLGSGFVPDEGPRYDPRLAQQPVLPGMEPPPRPADTSPHISDEPNGPNRLGNVPPSKLREPLIPGLEPASAPELAQVVGDVVNGLSRPTPPSGRPPKFVVNVARAIKDQETRAATWGDRLAAVGYSSMIGPATATVNVPGNVLETMWSVSRDVALQDRRISGYELSGVGDGLARMGLAAIDAIRGRTPTNPHLPVIQPANAADAALFKFTELGKRVFTDLPDTMKEFGRVLKVNREAGRIVDEEVKAGTLASDQAKGRFDQLTGDFWAQRADPNAPVRMPEFDRIEQASDLATRRDTFQDPLSNRQRDIRKGIEAWGPVGHWMFPFFGTPAKMLERITEKTPAGLAVGRDVRPRNERVYDAVVGTALLGGLVAMNQAGVIQVTGTGPEDPQERKALEATGRKGRSVIVGPYALPQQLFGEWAPVLQAIGEIHDIQTYGPRKRDPQQFDRIADAARRLGGVVGDFPYLRGFGDVIDFLSDPAAKLETFTERNVARLVPYASTLKAAAQAGDQLERRPDRAKDVGIGEAARQRAEQYVPETPLTPGFNRELMPPDQDVLGRPKPNERTGVVGAFLPRYGKASDEPVIRAFLDAGVDIPQPRTQITLNGIPIELTPEEQRRFAALRGEQLQRLVGPRAASGALDRMRPDVRSEVMTTLLQTANDTAEARLTAELPNRSQRLRDAIQAERARKAS